LSVTKGVLVSVDQESADCCAVCGDALRVKKTTVRGAITIAHGPMHVRQTHYRSCDGCGHDQPSRPLSDLVPAHGTFGYDVIVQVGIARFVHQKQRAEILTQLAQQGVELSAGEISILGRRFLDYLSALHRARAPQLRAALQADGGWPMHIDATGEDGRGTLLVVYAGWRDWALGSWKIPTERADAIVPRLRQVADRFGAPCAIMHDLGRAVREAADTFVAERELSIPVLSCHLHFLRDVGTDLMRKAHDALRERFRHFKVSAQLRALARSLGRHLGVHLAQAREALAHWQGERSEHRHRLPEGNTGLATVRALAQWVLDFPFDGHDQGFPFDVPQLDLYARCIEMLRALDAFLRSPPADPQVRRSAERLYAILRPVDSQVPFEQHARVLRARRSLFEQLRDALRLGPRPAALAPRPKPLDAADQLAQARTALDQLAASLRQARPQRGPAADQRRAIDLVLVHLDRYGPSLWGHAILLPDGTTRLVDRTNNRQEGFFRTFKHGERRRSGRKILTQDLEQIPATAALALNLRHHDYVDTLCGSLDQLPAAFAKLDASGAVLHDDDAVTPETVSRSLPTADRELVRFGDMFLRIAAASDSRAPRR
jgi:hypothetical protein